MIRFLNLVILLIISNLLNADPLKLNFRHLSLKEGLSQSTVNSIIEDKYGFLWIATGNGLNRYDGYKFSHFTYDRNTPTSLGDNATRKLCISSDDLLLVGTASGISVYNPTTNLFENYYLLHQEKIGYVGDILQMSSSTYLIASNLGLFIFEMGIGISEITSWSYGGANALLEIDNRYFIGGTQGVFEYNREDNKVSIVDGIKAVNVNVLLANNYNSDMFWVGTEEQGLINYNYIISESVNYKHLVSNANSLSSNTIRSLSYDSTNKLWIGSFVGLNILNELTGEIHQYFNTAYLDDEISQNSIRSIYRDSQGGMWCGTYFGGLNYYHSLKNQFDGFRYQQKSTNGLNDNVVNAIFENKDRSLWIGTNDNGLNIFLSDGTVKYYRHIEGDKTSLCGNNVKCIVPRPNSDEIWIGTHGGGLCIYNNSKFIKVDLSTSNNTNNRIYDIEFIDDNNVIIASLEGLFHYEIDKTRISSIVPDNAPDVYKEIGILSLYNDKRGSLWVGTQSGFSRYFLNDNKVDENIFNISQMGININTYDFYNDNNNCIWIATSIGLIKYSLKNEKFEDLNYMELPKTSYYKILSDNFNRFWISSTIGLIQIDKSTGKWRRYEEADGLFSNQFNPASGFRSSTGRLYFGGINGFNMFRPERLLDNPYTPNPIIDNISVYNRRVTPGDETGILPTNNIFMTNKISIPSKYSQFGIEFVALNYISQKSNSSYTYMLEGFDKEWYTTSGTGVTYSNLSPGKYRFLVKAANNSNKWCENPTELEIIILPKWYQSWIARLIFLLLAIGALYSLFRFRLRQQSMKHELEIEKLEKERLRETEQEKIRFFINVSHEIRTPLTLILSPVQEALKRGVTDKNLKKQLCYVQRNAQRMMHLVNQVLDYRRAEMGAMALQIKQSNIRIIVESIFELFSDLTQQKQIKYTLTNNLNKELHWIDPAYIDRILSNLLSNAIKFTPQNGTIEVILKEENDNLLIIVSDSGCGIPEEKQSKVFDRFYQVEENAQGTGVGLSFVQKLIEKHHGSISLESKIGEGSVFTVKLPSVKESFSDSECSDEEFDSTQFTSFLSSNMTLNEDSDIDEVIEAEEQEKCEQEKSVVLIVEDDKDIRNYLISNLSESYNVIYSENGEDAWKRISENEKIDLIISDVMMPVMDGITLCKKIKQNIHFCHIPIILLTAKSEAEDQLRGLKTGADDYLSKPFVMDILKTKIANILLSRRRIIRHYQNNVTVKSVEVATNVLDEELLEKAKKIILDRMENTDFSVEELSREMRMSRSNLHLKMKAITGESANDFIRRVRLSEACRMLNEGRYNIAEISTIIGFTPSYFSTIFKKQIGCLPTEYSEKCKI